MSFIYSRIKSEMRPLYKTLKKNGAEGGRRHLPVFAPSSRKGGPDIFFISTRPVLKGKAGRKKEDRQKYFVFQMQGVDKKLRSRYSLRQTKLGEGERSKKRAFLARCRHGNN